MSIYRMTDVWKYSKHKANALLVMLALADVADDYGVCWPGYEHLAHKARISRISAIRLTDYCHASGELWKLNRSQQRSNVYIVTVGLAREDLQIAGERALKLGVTPPTGSIKLIPPPQVVEVVSKCYHVVSESYQVVIPVIPGSNIAMIPDPSLPVITQGDETCKLWSSVLSQLCLTMTKDTFDRHLLGSTVIQQNGTLTVTVPNAGSVEWLAARLRPRIAEVVAREAGRPLEIIFTQ